MANYVAVVLGAGDAETTQLGDITLTLVYPEDNQNSTTVIRLVMDVFYNVARKALRKRTKYKCCYQYAKEDFTYCPYCGEEYKDESIVQPDNFEDDVRSFATRIFLDCFQTDYDNLDEDLDEAITDGDLELGFAPRYSTQELNVVIHLPMFDRWLSYGFKHMAETCWHGHRWDPTVAYFVKIAPFKIPNDEEATMVELIHGIKG